MRKLILPVLLIVLAGCRTQENVRAPFAFGLVADIQYADKEPSGARHYRSSLERLQACVDELNQHDLAFTIQLGDLIDGNSTPEQTRADLDKVLQVFNALRMPRHHVIGNHCLTAGADRLQQKLQLDAFHYTFTAPAAEGWRFIVLSGTDAGPGVLGKAQLTWLEDTLKSARTRGEMVLVFNHYALLEDAAPNVRMKEPDPVLNLLEKAGCVAAYFAGHDHAGGYGFRNGIHHVTLRGMVEAAGQNAFAIITVAPDGLTETGFGKEPNRKLLRPGD